MVAKNFEDEEDDDDSFGDEMDLDEKREQAGI